MLRTYKNRIRPIAISIIRKNDKILVYERQDDITKENFYRLIGGCVEFEEKSDVALKREFMEEISVELKDLKLLSTFESIFTFNDISMHEIVFLYESKFKLKNLYNQEQFVGIEGERKFTAVWKKTSDFIDKKDILYPETAADFL